jgi:hypothetical protein
MLDDCVMEARLRAAIDCENALVLFPRLRRA